LVSVAVFQLRHTLLLQGLAVKSKSSIGKTETKLPELLYRQLFPLASVYEIVLYPNPGTTNEQEVGQLRLPEFPATVQLHTANAFPLISLKVRVTARALLFP